MQIKKFIKENYKILCIIFILAVFSVFINGYFYGGADSALRSTIIKKMLDPTLYKNDLMVGQSSTFYTYVHYLLMPFYRLFGIETVSFFSYLLGHFFSYIAVFCLAKFLFKDNKVALLSVILLMVNKPAMGGETFRPYFLESEFALPVLLFAFMFMLKKRYLISSFLAGIAVNLHITSAMPAFGILFIYMLFNYKKIGIKTIAYSAVVFIFGALPMLLWILLQKSSMQLIMPEFILNVMKLTLVHHFFPLTWFTNKIYIERWIRFFAFFAAFLVAFKYKPEKGMHKAVKTFFYGLVILLLGVIFFTYIIPQPLIMNLQFFRSTKWIMFFGAIYLSNYLVKEYSKAGLASKMILAGLGSSFFISNFKGVLIFLILLMADRFRNTKIASIPAFTAGLAALALAAISTFYPSLPFISQLKIGLLPFFIILFTIMIAFVLEILNWKIVVSTKKLIAALSLLLILVFASFGMTSLRWSKYPFGGDAVFELSLTGAAQSNAISLAAFKRILTEPRKYITHNVQYLYEFPRNEWEDLQLWVNKNTNKEDTLITPVNLAGFRLYSERTIVGEWLEVVLSTVNEDYARKIWERMGNMCNSEIFGHCEGEYGYRCTDFCGEQYNGLDENYFMKLSKKYSAGYVVVEKPKALKFKLAYENEKYRVYKV